MTPVAKLAAECVKEVLADSTMSQLDKKEYLSRVKGIGSLVIQNGLAGAVLFTKNIKKKGTEKVIEHLNKLIEEQTGIKDFSEKLINGEEFTQQAYLQMQYAALEGIKWLRRYADILLGGD